MGKYCTAILILLLIASIYFVARLINIENHLDQLITQLEVKNGTN